MRLPPPSYIANFDSATAMLRATARYLGGKDFPALGQGAFLKPLVKAGNRLAREPREMVYAAGGWGEAIAGSRTGSIREERIARWAAGLYPQRAYPGAMIGSASGALVHLAVALGMPWLPQTFLLAVKQSDVHPDEPRHALEAARFAARALLEENPHLQLHHMHDPNQDRLMLSLMTYFRVKWLTLPEAYRHFFEHTLPPHSPLFLTECRRSWPTTRIGDRYVYQFGALGGATEQDFFEGSDRVEAYLARYHSHRHRWDPPAPNGEAPEAEWGFEPRLRDSIEQMARERGLSLVKIVFDEPEHLSPLVADLYRWWYRRRRIPANRLLVSSFILMEPYWTLRTGSVPFWMKFNMAPSADWLEHYLDGVEPFDEINLILFSHGVECVGVPPMARWRELLQRARKRGAFAGVDEQAYPRDFSVLARYHDAVRAIPARYPLPGPLSIQELAQFVRESGDRYPVTWEGLEEAAATRH